MADKDGKKFFPYYLFEIAVIALLAVEAVLLLSALFPVSIGREIDYAARYSPRPEWYFLFLYQISKYFPGKWTFIGAALLPGLAFAVILLAPFLERGAETSIARRKTAAVAGFGMLTAVIVLTALALMQG